MTFKERFGSNIKGDIFGGVTAGIVALPLALGFGVASGLENGAAAGLYGAIVVGIMAAIFGGTPAQISGPTGPMTVVIAGMAAALTGDPMLVFATVALAGIVQVILGLLRLGRYINFIPYPVVSGFMSGIGVIIIILQFAQIVGHSPEKSILAAVHRVPAQFQAINFAALLLGLATIALIYIVPKLTKIIPNTLVALAIMTVVSVLLPVDVPRIGSIPSGLPELRIPQLDWTKVQLILIPALMLGVIGSLDSLLTSLVADRLTKSRHDSERELIGQGIGNLLAGLVGGLPGAGATMRTVVNIKSGGRTHLSGVTHGLVLVLFLMVLGPLAAKIPMSVLAGILITVGIGIVDTKGLSHIFKVSRGDALVMISVLLITVFVDLMWAVGVGMVLASLILVKRLSDMDPATHSPLMDIAAYRLGILSTEDAKQVSKGIFVVKIHGSLFFGNAGPLQRNLGSIQEAHSIILDMSEVRYLDQSGVYALTDLIEDQQKRGAEVFLCELQEEPQVILAKLGLCPGTIPIERVFKTEGGAVRAAVRAHAQLHGLDVDQTRDALFAWRTGDQLTADEALGRLVAGNERYIRGESIHPHTNPETRTALLENQRPFAVILGCADSRSVPELVFDQGIGELFVLRVAGNIVSPENNGSIEFATEYLGVQLVVVLGHQGCGAVKACIDGLKSPGNIHLIIDAIQPAVDMARKTSGDLVATAIKCNAKLVAEKLKNVEPVLADAVRRGRLRIVPAYYHLDSGRIEFIE